MSFNLTNDEQYEIEAQGFALDLVLQLYQLRQKRRIPEEELSNRTGLRKQLIKNFEAPGYDKHTLESLKKIAKELGAYVSVVIVPVERLEEYSEKRFYPVMEPEKGLRCQK